MKKLFCLILVILFGAFANGVLAENEVEVAKTQTGEYSIDISVSNIPENQQTLYIPIDIDANILDLDKVALEGISSQNILPVAASSKDKVGPGVGLLKLDDKGFPSKLQLKVYLKPVTDGSTNISVSMVADLDALPVKGAKIREDVKVALKTNVQIEVSETEEAEGKKRLNINERQLTLSVDRQGQQAETIFVPFLYDKKVFDIDETFGHSIIAPGISVKSFGSSSLHQGGPGVEIVLSETAEEDFDIPIDLLPKGVGQGELTLAYPQEGHTAILTGPVVQISPTKLSVALAKSETKGE